MTDDLTFLDHVRGRMSDCRWGWIGRWFRRRCRRIDRQILFGGLPREAVAMHCWLDPAWRFEDEWKDEPEAAWFRQTIIAFSRSIMGEVRENEKTYL